MIANQNILKALFIRLTRISIFAIVMTFAPSTISSGQAQPIERYSTGLIPAKPDDIKSAARSPTYRAFLDESVDLSDLFPIPGDQASQGSCSAWAVGYAARSYWTLKAENRDIRNNANIPSPTYIFNRSRESNSCKEGSTIVRALTVLRDVGSLSWRQLPYDENYCRIIPQSLESEVSDFRISGWNYIEPSRTDGFLDNVKGLCKIGSRSS